MLLRFIKKYAEFLCLGGFLLYWLWDAKLSGMTKGFTPTDWMSLASTSATLILAGIGAWGINSWKSEYKKKEQYKTAVNFGEHAKNSIDALRHIASGFYLPNEIPNDMSNSIDSHSEIISHLLNSYAPTINKLYARLNRSQIVLGDDASKIYNMIHSSVRDINEHCAAHHAIAKNINNVRATANVHAPSISLEKKQQSSFKIIQELEDERRLLRKTFFKKLKTDITTIQLLIDNLLAKNTIN